MTLRNFLTVLNLKVRYNVIDRFTREVFDFSHFDFKKYHHLLDREIYMVFQSGDGMLEIYLL